ncbi:hypothetical protein N7523_001354 [Penicillium sp. IBT 18751x]|nr:hypothetical protein N7523_001354 [Penicillium sp. IBT 18751x]
MELVRRSHGPDVGLMVQAGNVPHRRRPLWLFPWDRLFRQVLSTLSCSVTIQHWVVEIAAYTVVEYSSQ